MTTESTPGAGQEPSIPLLLLEALREGPTDGSGLLKLLARAPMSDEQQLAIEMLASLAEQSESTEGQGSTDGLTHEELAETQELEALREMNDTLASALGACRLCWGGGADCPACSGRGRPGSRLPDRQLFEALIVPAIQRVRAARQPRAPASPDGRRGTIVDTRR